MGMNQLDTISAKEGNVFITVAGKTFEVAELTKMDAEIELQTATVTPIGTRMEGAKIVGAKGSGNIEFYYQNPAIRKIIADYVKRGFYPEISIKATNNDITSSAGRQTYLLKGVIFTKAKIFEIDGGSNDVLKDESPFIFNDIDELESFKVK